MRDVQPSPTDAWRTASLFATLNDEEIAWLSSRIGLRSLAAGEVLLEEGETPRHVFVLQSGRLEILKREKLGRRRHRIQMLGQGATVGEVALLDQSTRTATVRAREPSEVWEFDFVDLRARATVGRDGSEDALWRAHEKSAMGELIVNVLILLCVYMLLISGLETLGLKPRNTMYLSLPILALLGVVSWRFMVGSGFPLADFGITSRHLGRALWDAGLLTVALLLAVTGIKWLLIQTNPRYAGLPLIEYPDVLAQFSTRRTQILAGVYAASSAVQELIVRGALQSMLERFLTGRYRRLRAITVCTLLFSVSHLHTGLLFTLAVLIPGFCWGLLFTRNRNLIGVIVSHVIIGLYVFFVLGVRL
jgi:membrane protease YdiL (CAAX protease family)